MNKKQDRRSINLPAEIHEQLSYLQAETRLLMKNKDIDHVLRKTAMTKLLSALIKSVKPTELINLLK